jgi:hypothetical protein
VRPPSLVSALVGAAVLLAACGGGGADVPEPSSTPTATSTSASPTPTATTTAEPAARLPLTGVGVSSVVAANRPAVGVAVQMVPGGRLSGISTADLVYVEFDRARHARLIAMYQSADAASVGPVTGTSPVDGKLLTLFGTPAFGFDGGPTGFVAQAKPPALNPRDAAGSYRSLFRAGAGGLVVSTTALRASQRGGAPPMAGVLTFASDVARAPTGPTPLTRIVVSVPGQDPITFTWSGGGWSGPGGSRLANIVVQYVPYKTLTPHKSPTVRSALVVGSGLAKVYAGQYGASTTWSRRFPGIVTVYAAGPRPVGLLPGRSWVLLVPTGTRVASS